jgi:hypothetical protein
MWDKLESLLLWIPKKIIGWILDKLAGLIESIPVPEFFSQANSALASIPSEVGYFIEPMNFGVGLSMIISAYIIRFIIRRIPIVG